MMVVIVVQRQRVELYWSMITELLSEVLLRIPSKKPNLLSKQIIVYGMISDINNLCCNFFTSNWNPCETYIPNDRTYINSNQ